MKIAKDHQHRDVYRACLNRNELMRIAAEHVANEAGIDLHADGVTWNSNFSGSPGLDGYQFDVLITIIDDHAKKAAAA